MKCIRCKSHRIMKFIDGFGQRRYFCKNCGVSFVEYSHILPNGQKSLLGTKVDLYYRPGIVPRW